MAHVRVGKIDLVGNIKRIFYEKRMGASYRDTHLHVMRFERLVHKSNVLYDLASSHCCVSVQRTNAYIPFYT